MLHIIYKITNQLNQKVYIGQTVNLHRRWQAHKNYAKNPETTGQYIHRAMAKYGADSFTIEIVDFGLCVSQANCLERYYIQLYDSRNRECGYNISMGGDFIWNTGLPKEQQPRYGKKNSQLHNERISRANIGRRVIISHDTRRKISASLMGHHISSETKWKISKANTGHAVSLEARHNMSKAKRGDKHPNYGRCLSEETRKKISQSNTGKTHSSETKGKLSAYNVGKTLTQEIRDKIAKSNMGKIMSDETKRKIGEKNKGRHMSDEQKNAISVAHSKLSLAQKLEIENDGRTNRELSMIYGVSAATISRIKNRRVMFI